MDKGTGVSHPELIICGGHTLSLSLFSHPSLSPVFKLCTNTAVGNTNEETTILLGKVGRGLFEAGTFEPGHEG